MKEYMLYKNSWHYKLANFGSGFQKRVTDETDICTYMRSIMIGSLAMTFMIIGFSAMGAALAYAVYSLVALIFFGIPLTALGTGLVTVLLGTIGGVGVTWTALKAAEKIKETEPGFARLVYNRIKNKTCVKIKFAAN